MSLQSGTIIDQGVVVGGVNPDLSSAIGYKETVGSACQNPNGYTQGSCFINTADGFLYEATTAIAYGTTLTSGTNCSKTDVCTKLNELNADIATKASKEWTVLGGYGGGSGSHSMPANYNEILFKINVNGSGVIIPLYILKGILPTNPTTQQFRGGYWATATTGCMVTIQASDEEFALIACYLNGADVLSGTSYSVMYR